MSITDIPACFRCVATGWGQTTQDGDLESRLHEVVLRVVNNTDCDTMYSLKYGVKINSGHVCAGPDLGTVTGTCVVRDTTNYFIYVFHTFYELCKDSFHQHLHSSALLHSSPITYA